MSVPLRTASSPREVLSLMEELYKDEKRWTKGSYARSRFRRPVDVGSAKAVSFCLNGACLRFSHYFGDQLSGAIDALTSCMGGLDIVAFNDSPSTTIDDIRRVISEAKKRV